MENKELQLENGNYTRIVNKVIDELVKVSLLGAELAICLFVIRKTYGFNKKEDQISLSQFEEGVKRSRPTVNKALKNLQLINILQLVKVGSSKTSSSVWRFNKYYNTWNTLVNTSQLVKDRTSTSKEKLKKLVKTPKHTKDNTKNNIQKTSKTPKEFLEGEQWNQLIDPFQRVNPMYKNFYKLKTERHALSDMAKEIGFAKLKWLIDHLKEAVSKPYAPKITRPTELRRDMGKLIIFWEQEKSKINKDTKVGKL